MRAMPRPSLALITLRRELAARYARIQRLWVAARNAYRRAHQAPVQDLTQLRQAAERLHRREHEQQEDDKKSRAGRGHQNFSGVTSAYSR